MSEESTLVFPEQFHTNMSKQREPVEENFIKHQPRYTINVKNNTKKLNKIDPDSQAFSDIMDIIQKDEREEIDMSEFNQFEKRLDDKIMHQAELSLQRYENLSSSLSKEISNSIDKLEMNQKHYFEKSDLKTEKLLSEFKIELDKERKSNRNVIIGWALGAATLAVTAASIIIPMLI